MAKTNIAKGKWGAIHILNIDPLEYDVNEESYGTKITFSFKHASSVTTKWEPTDSSLRVYYRKYSIATGAPIGETEHDDIHPEDCMYYGKYGKSTKVVYKVLGFEYEEGVCYHFNVWLRVYNYDVEMHVDAYTREYVEVPTTLKKTYKEKPQSKYFVKYVAPPVPLPDYASETPQHLFKIAKYVLNNEGTDYFVNFDDKDIDFTDCITLPSYDVSREDVTESWDDANYDQHILVPTRKIKGKFSMLFPSMERYNEFLYYIAQAKQHNVWSPNACVLLHVQVNNELDYNFKYTDVQHAAAVHEQGNFTIKIDSNPWVKPIVGHFDKYSPINVTIEQVDTDME